MHALPKAPPTGQRKVPVCRLLAAPPPKNLFCHEGELEGDDKHFFKKYTVLESVDGKKMYKCILCSNKRKTREAIICHLLKEHDDGTVASKLKTECICGFKSLNQHSFRQHTRRCKNPYSCPYLGKSGNSACLFTSVRSSDMKRHILTHDISGHEIACTNCDMKFTSKASLNRHNRSSSCQCENK